MDKLFDNKRKYTDFDGEEYYDMCIPAINISKLNGNSMVKLTHDDNGRLDKFTWANVGKDLNLMDLVMYSNKIFNPFSVQEGDLIYVPLSDDSVYEKIEECSLPDGSKYSNNINPQKSRTYAETVEYLAKKGLGVK